jgi:hypothetical protein
MTNIALMGKARSGKDSVAGRLCEAHGYARVAFADPLKAHALSVNPIVGSVDTWTGEAFRLSDAISEYGWERAKDEYPEVRRILQHIGQGVRELDPDFWISVALRSIGKHLDAGTPVVVSDVRYPNEVDTLRAAGFRIVRIVRPLKGALTIAEARAAMHDSETALDDESPDALIYNGGSLAELAQRADALTT